MKLKDIRLQITFFYNLVFQTLTINFCTFSIPVLQFGYILKNNFLLRWHSIYVALNINIQFKNTRIRKISSHVSIELKLEKI